MQFDAFQFYVYMYTMNKQRPGTRTGVGQVRAQLVQHIPYFSLGFDSFIDFFSDAKHIECGLIFTLSPHGLT